MTGVFARFALAGVGAAAVTFGIVAGLVRFAPRIGLVDRPNERSSHVNPTPRGGGIGFVITAAAGLALLFAGAIGRALEPALVRPVVVLLVASVAVAAISLWDDFRSIGAGVRLAMHLSAGAAAVWGAGRIGIVEMPLLGSVELGVAGAAVTVLWVAGLTNVYNFMDGIDGIAGVQGLAAGVAWTIAGVWMGWPVAAWLGAVLAGGCAGFLGHNWSPARIFMGDVGSAFLGFLFAAIALVARQEAGEVGGQTLARLPIFAILAVFPFVGDGTLTLVRRALKREAVWRAHRSHLYQRLVISGWSHARVSSLFAAWAAASVAVGLFWLTGRPGSAAAAAVFPPLSVAAMFALTTLRERSAAAS